jgi:hypothetical protein
MDHCVFIHTNHKQWLGALVGQYALRRNSRHNDRFDVRILHTRDYPFLWAREGEWFLRDGGKRTWRYDDLQSFTPLRFMPPELMGYSGRAVVIEPDVFAVDDIGGLLSRDMQGHALLCRAKSGFKGKKGCLASSVMLLDCAKLTHWRCEEQFNAMFEFKRDYMDWVCLKYEDRDAIGLFEEEWNDAWYHCLPGNAQVANIWLRLYQETGEEKYLEAGSRTVRFLKRHHSLTGPSSVRGGLPGSYPIFGKYMYLRYPNWGVKFFADALLNLEETLSS